MPSKPSRIRWQNQTPGNRAEPGAGRRETGSPPDPDQMRNAPSLLAEIGRDLTGLARAGRLGPVFGREHEIRHLQRILLRKQKNNPIIIGQPGVGKTALVEGLALQLAHGPAPHELRALEIIELAVSSLTAGTAYRGAFDARLAQLVAETARNPRLVVFIDEIHTLVRAGAVEGNALDAANLLKPALARGELRCIGATTPDEFDRFMRSDPAFERRFEPLILEEPSIAETIEILSAARPAYQDHHHVQIQPEAIDAAVRLSVRHVLERCLPDKAFDLLDNACALVRLPDPVSGTNVPPQPLVTAESVGRALADKMGIPLEKLSEDQQDRLAGLEARLGERVFGQPWALASVAGSLRKALAGLGDPDRPRYIAAFFGGSGTGKTATARALAELLFDSPEALIRLDMAEYKEPHAIARLFGAPPGYVGYHDEGTFASRLRRQPYSIVLLDEIEKAHPEIQDAWLQIFDEGRFTDARGRLVDARQAIFILTSNLFSLGEIATREEYQAHAEAVRQRLEGFFRAEFVDRIDDVVLFGALSQPALVQIASREISALNERMSLYGISVQAGPEVLDWIADQARSGEIGARGALRLIQRQIAEPVSAGVVEGKINPGERLEIVVSGGNLELRSATG